MRFAPLLPLLLLGSQGGDLALPERYQGLAKSAVTRLDRVWGTPEQHVYLPSRVAYTADGKTALVASSELAEKDADDFIAVWDLDKSEVRRTLTIKKAVATALAVTPDGKYAVAGTFAGERDKGTVQLLVWDLPAGKLLNTLKGTKEAILSLAFSADGKRLLAGSNDGAVQLWDVAGGKLLHTLEGHKGHVMCVAFSPDGTQALSGGGQNNFLRLHDVATGKELANWLAGPNGFPVTAARFLPDGKRVVTVALDQVPILWDIKDKKELQRYKKEPLGNGLVLPLALSADGKRLVSFRTPYNQILNAVEPFVTCWDVDSGKDVWSTKVDLPLPTPLAFLPGGKTLLLGGGESCFMHLDPATGKLQKIWGGHRGAVVVLAVEPKGDLFWTAGQDKTVKRWSQSERNELFTLRGHDDAVTGLAVVGDTLLTASGDKTMKLWQLGTDKLLKTYTGHTAGITGLAVARDGKHAVTSSGDRSLKLWDLASGKCLKTLTGHSHAVTAVDISPDGKWAVSGSEDSTVRLWYLPDDNKDIDPVVLEGHKREVTAVRFTQDGKHVLSASQDQTVKLWDVAKGKEVRAFTGHKNWITGLAVLSEANLLVTSCDDLTVKVWNLQTGKEVDSLDFGTASDVAKAVVAAPDGRAFLVGTANWLVLRFEVKK
jgi:WD40 repeat protein